MNKLNITHDNCEIVLGIKYNDVKQFKQKIND